MKKKLVLPLDLECQCCYFVLRRVFALFFRDNLVVSMSLKCLALQKCLASVNER